MARNSIEAWLCSTLPGANILRLSIDGIAFFPLTLTADAVLATALADWQAQANAHATLSARTWSITRDLVAQTVTISANGAIWATLSGSLPPLLGWPSASLAGSTTYTSTQQPRAMGKFAGLGFDIAKNVESVTLLEFRHGRSDAVMYSGPVASAWTVYMTAAQFATFRGGPLFSGLIRIRANNSGSGFSPTVLGGYQDVMPARKLMVDTRGAAEGWVRVTFEATTVDL